MLHLCGSLVSSVSLGVGPVPLVGVATDGAGGVPSCSGVVGTVTGAWEDRLMWDVDVDWVDQVLVRAGEFSCCAGAEREGPRSVADHWVVHRALFEQRMDGPDVAWRRIDWGDDDSDATEVECVSTVVGVVSQRQRAPLDGSWATWVTTPSGSQHHMTLRGDGVDDPNDPATSRQVREYMVVSDVGGLNALGVVAGRPDPLFRLPGRRLEFDERWPLPDPGRRMLLVAPSAESSSVADLGDAVGLCDHLVGVSTVAQVAAGIGRAARFPDRYGAVLVVRGGGPGWQDLFDAVEVTDAIRAVQRAGLCVATGVGHTDDVTAAELAADFAFGTPSELGVTLRLWSSYLAAEASSADTSMEPDTYLAGQRVRGLFDRAWARHHGSGMCPRLSTI